MEVHQHTRGRHQALVAWKSLPETHPILRDNGPTTRLGIPAPCGDEGSVFRIEVLDTEVPAVYDVLESPKAVSGTGEHPL